MKFLVADCFSHVLEDKYLFAKVEEADFP